MLNSSIRTVARTVAKRSVAPSIAAAACCTAALPQRQQPAMFLFVNNVKAQSRSFSTSMHCCQEQQTQQQQQQTVATSQQKPSVTIFGGSGFIGKHVVRKLAPHCSNITVGCRYPGEFNAWIQQESKNDASLSVVSAQEVNVVDPVRVSQLVAGADVVINLVGSQYESDQTFVETFVDGARNIFHACRLAQTKQAVHLGMLGAELDSESRWLDYVARADDMAYAAFPDVTLLRSSLVYGPGARLFERSKLLPIVPSGTSGLFQPVHVDDVAEAILRVIQREDSKASIYELAGPKVYDAPGLKRAATGSSSVPVPALFFDLFWGLTQFLPNPTFTRDHVPLLDSQMVLTKEPTHKSFKDLGIEPKSIEQ